MQDKEAAEILAGLLDKHELAEQEKAAVRTAIGILSWSKLGQTRIKNIIKSQKAKRGSYLEDKRIESNT